MFWMTLIYLFCLLVVFRLSMRTFRQECEREAKLNRAFYSAAPTEATLENYLKSDYFFYACMGGLIPLLNIIVASAILFFQFAGRLWRTKLAMKMRSIKL